MEEVRLRAVHLLILLSSAHLVRSAETSEVTQRHQPEKNKKQTPNMASDGSPSCRGPGIVTPGAHSTFPWAETFIREDGGSVFGPARAHGPAEMKLYDMEKGYKAACDGADGSGHIYKGQRRPSDRSHRGALQTQLYLNLQ